MFDYFFRPDHKIHQQKVLLLMPSCTISSQFLSVSLSPTSVRLLSVVVVVTAVVVLGILLLTVLGILGILLLRIRSSGIVGTSRVRKGIFPQIVEKSPVRGKIGSGVVRIVHFESVSEIEG